MISVIRRNPITGEVYDEPTTPTKQINGHNGIINVTPKTEKISCKSISDFVFTIKYRKFQLRKMI